MYKTTERVHPKTAEVIVIGAGPCGLAAAIALQEKGLKPLIIEKGECGSFPLSISNTPNLFQHPRKAGDRRGTLHHRAEKTDAKSSLGLLPRSR